MVICLERDADLHMAQLMPLPLTVSCFSKIPIGFTFLVPACPGSPGKRAGPLNGCVWYWCRWPGCSCGRVVGPYDVQWNGRCQRRAVDQWHDHRQCRAGGLRCRGSARPGAGEATEELRRVGPVGRRRRSHTEGQPARTDSGKCRPRILQVSCVKISPFFRSAVGMAMDPHGYAYGMGMGIEIPSHDSPAVFTCATQCQYDTSYGPMSVCVSIISRSSFKTAARIELILVCRLRWLPPARACG